MDLRADHAQEAATLSTEYNSKLPAGHQLWMANAVNYHSALTKLKTEGVDVTGTTFKPRRITLKKGGV